MVDNHEISQAVRKWEPIIEALGSFDQEKTNFLAVYAENHSRYDMLKSFSNERTISQTKSGINPELDSNLLPVSLKILSQIDPIENVVMTNEKRRLKKYSFKHKINRSEVTPIIENGQLKHIQFAELGLEAIQHIESQFIEFITNYLNEVAQENTIYIGEAFLISLSIIEETDFNPSIVWVLNMNVPAEEKEIENGKGIFKRIKNKLFNSNKEEESPKNLDRFQLTIH